MLLLSRPITRHALRHLTLHEGLVTQTQKLTIITMKTIVGLWLTGRQQNKLNEMITKIRELIAVKNLFATPKPYFDFF